VAKKWKAYHCAPPSPNQCKTARSISMPFFGIASHLL